jgi:hypothetical protein
LLQRAAQVVACRADRRGATVDAAVQCAVGVQQHNQVAQEHAVAHRILKKVRGAVLLGAGDREAEAVQPAARRRLLTLGHIFQRLRALQRPFPLRCRGVVVGSG